MGRQKPNKQRRERPSVPNAGRQRQRDIADMLDLPTMISADRTGTVLDVSAVGFAGDGYTTGDKPAYVRLTDGSVKLLPEGLRPWAHDLITRHLAHRAAGHDSIFPCAIEFGTVDGSEYAVLQGSPFG
jgi:hypothetical protein